MAFTPDQLIGPVGVAVIALIAVAVLWREVQADRRRDRELIAKLTAVVEQFPQAVQAQTKVIEDYNRRLEDDRRDSMRRDRRSTDGR